MDQNNEKRSDIEEKVKQTIRYGSPYEALITGFVQCEDILNYLLNVDVGLREMVAYRAVCQFSREQIVRNNSKHNDKPFVIVTEHDEYVGIYNLSVNTFFGRTDQESINIAKRTQKVWPRLMNNNAFSRSIHLICDSSDLKNIKLDEQWLIIAARSKKCISSIQRKINPNMWLNGDYLDILDNIEYELYENDLLNRCKMLKEFAPLYWENVAKKLYQTLVFKNINLEKIRKDLIKKYGELFPEIIPEKYTNMSDLVYNLKELSDVRQAYVLGYPIHLYIPSREILDKTIEMVDKIGIDNYAKIIEDKNKQSMNNHVDMISPVCSDKIIISNEEDVLMENIYSYNSFDVVRYYVDNSGQNNGQKNVNNHVYYFTRPEYPELITKKKNLWTNKLMPISVLTEINSRLEMSMLYKLPKSMGIKDLLRHVNEGTLYELCKSECTCHQAEQNEQEEQNQENNSVRSVIPNLQNIQSGFHSGQNRTPLLNQLIESFAGQNYENIENNIRENRENRENNILRGRNTEFYVTENGNGILISDMTLDNGFLEQFLGNNDDLDSDINNDDIDNSCDDINNEDLNTDDDEWDDPENF